MKKTTQEKGERTPKTLSTFGNQRISV